jgi:hypothetical protein
MRHHGERPSYRGQAISGVYRHDPSSKGDGQVSEAMRAQLDRRELVPWGWAPGSYMGRCGDCQAQWIDGDKRAYRCERCAMIARYTEAEKKLADLAYLTT